METLYNFIDGHIYNYLDREKCKSTRVTIVSAIERVLNSAVSMSKNSIGITLRSIHIAGPFILLLILMVSKYQLMCSIIIFIFVFIPSLFILLDGCLLSSLENRYLNDGFNVIDPLLEMKHMKINKKNRMKMNYFMCFIYLIMSILIYAYRFYI